MNIREVRLPEALKSYRDELAIRGRLAKPNPGNPGWQRDLSVSYLKIGDVLMEKGNLPEALKAYRNGIAIRDRLAKSNPGNPGWQRDLSVSYEKIGDVLVAQGNLPEALKSYGDVLAIRERLAKADPDNMGWQQDLSASYNSIGDVLMAQNNLPEALEAYREGLAIRERLAKAGPSNPGWLRDLSVSYSKLGIAFTKMGDLNQDRSGNSAIRVEEADDPLRLLKRLNQPVQEDAVETTIMPMDAVLVMRVEEFMTPPGCKTSSGIVAAMPGLQPWPPVIPHAPLVTSGTH